MLTPYPAPEAKPLIRKGSALLASPLLLYAHVTLGSSSRFKSAPCGAGFPAPFFSLVTHVGVVRHTAQRYGWASWRVETKPPMPRLKVSPGGLYTLLNAELKRRRVVDCGCRMPLPYHIDRPDPVSANWRIGTAAPCGRGCDAMIAEIEASLWPKYDLLESITQESEVQGQPEPQA